MKKIKYNLANLDCANCANKLEKHLNKDENLNNVVVNFAKLTMTLETDLDNPKEYIIKKSHEVEDEVEIYELDEEINNNDFKVSLIMLIIGIILSILGCFVFKGITSKITIILAFIVLLYKVVYIAIKMLLKLKIDEHLLITISCIGAYAIGSIHEGLMVIILYDIGKVLESLAVNNSRKSISELMDIKPEYANLKIKDEIVKVDPLKVSIGDSIIVKKGERIPLDGEIIKGTTLLDTSALTGESKLVNVKKGTKVLSGSINTDNIIEIKVTEIYENSTVASILNLVENATDRKTKTENFVSKVAKIYTPIVLLLAILTLILLPLLFNIPFNKALYKALTFLVISCPCAIAISVPLGYFSGIGACSKENILVKGSDYLDTLKDINKIIFDKTGTITTGDITSFNLNIINNKYSEDEILTYLVKGEKLSNHPLAKAIIKYYNREVSTKDIKKFKEISGKGINYEINNQKIMIGSASYLKIPNKDDNIYIKIDNELVAKLERTDTIKENAKETINKLNDMGIRTLMFTGDSKNVALDVAKKVMVNEVKSDLLPEDKYNELEYEIKKNALGKTAFVGDGINDAPSLARADIGISMGSIGSASAIEASDIVIANDDISKIITAIKISKKTNFIIKENLIFAISIKILILILSILGLANMWQAVFADTGLTLLTIINTTRILRK